MKDTIQRLGEKAPNGKKGRARAAGLRAGPPKERDEVIDVLKRGYDNEQPKNVVRMAGLRVPNERAVDGWYAPRNRAVAVFQSAMDEYLDKKVGKVVEPAKKKSARGLSIGGPSKPAKPAATINTFYEGGKPRKPGQTRVARIAEQFSNLDPRWVEVAWEKAKLFLKGKRKFIAHKSVTDFRFDLKEDATIAIVGDWGGGNAAAQAVADQIRKLKPDYTIHLGDVYYAGTPKEVKERFLKFWPPPSAAGKSFALNSNHEMYSGGYGYFDTILKEFKQPASYFSLANKDWRFIGLDTGYVEHDLTPEQVTWLMAQFKGNNQRTILLTHHQLFSAYEKTDATNLKSRVQPLLDAGQIYGWIWGHEHLCVVYKKQLGIEATCLGNGCFPYGLPKTKPQVPVAWFNNRAQQGDKEYPGIHTFALLKVSKDKIDIQYIDQDGFVGYQQTWK
jgi:predicted phosphodiesterase